MGLNSCLYIYVCWSECVKAISKLYSFQCPALQEYTGYKALDLRECVLIIHDLYLGRRGGSLEAVRDKYKQIEVFLSELCLTFFLSHI